VTIQCDRGLGHRDHDRDRERDRDAPPVTMTDGDFVKMFVCFGNFCIIVFGHCFQN
jgi:hypothetical protein